LKKNKASNLQSTILASEFEKMKLFIKLIIILDIIKMNKSLTIYVSQRKKQIISLTF